MSISKNVALAIDQVNSHSDISRRYTGSMDRAKRLREIIDTRFGGNQADLARHLGKSPSLIWQYLSGHRMIGEKFARELEQKVVLPKGWMDALPFSDSNGLPKAANIDPGPRIQGRVPLISWIQAGNWSEAMDLFEPGDADQWIECPFAHSDLSFALHVRGISMETEFKEGDIIIVDPTRQPDPGRFVVAKKIDTNEATFKQLIQEAGEFYLKAINPDWPEKIIRMDEEWTINGVVVGKMKSY